MTATYELVGYWRGSELSFILLRLWSSYTLHSYCQTRHFFLPFLPVVLSLQKNHDVFVYHFFVNEICAATFGKAGTDNSICRDCLPSDDALRYFDTPIRLVQLPYLASLLLSTFKILICVILSLVISRYILRFCPSGQNSLLGRTSVYITSE